jgi:hypothetical protein
MKTLFTAVVYLGLVSVLILAVAGAAGAETLISPPLFIDFRDGVTCYILNVSAKDRTVDIQVINGSGTVIVDSGSLTVAPGHTKQEGGGVPDSDTYYCKFTTSSGKGDYRAAIARFSALAPTASDLNGYPVQ